MNTDGTSQCRCAELMGRAGRSMNASKAKNLRWPRLGAARYKWRLRQRGGVIGRYRRVSTTGMTQNDGWMRTGARLSAHYARRTKRPLDVVQWLQVIAQQTQVAADQTASHPASHRCAQCKRWHNLSSAKCFRSCVHAFSAALHARQFLGQIPVVLKLQRSTI